MKTIAQLLLLLVATTALAAARPNIILIMTDDQGYGDLGATGNTVIDTPSIDKMATESASLSRFYVSPVCSPTRACLMTGRYNYRTRCIDTFRGRSNMDPAEFTIAEAMRAGGYATGIFGKWHLGDCYPMRAMDQGFDESLVLNGGGLAQPADPIENDNRYTNPVLVHNGKRVATKGYCTDVYFDAAIKFIETQNRAEKPFFAYVAPNAPHGPFHDVPEDLRKKYMAKDMSAINFGRKLNAKDHDKLARIAAMIENIDQNVGRLNNHLKKLGIERDTIVIFMVDNGPNTARYVGNARGNKTHVHEGGIHSPFFIRWPGTLQPGIASDRIAAHIDVMPTLLDAAGIAIPKNLDGTSVLPLLKREKVQWPERTIHIQTHRGDTPQRYHHFAAITQRWKLVRPSGFGSESPKANAPFELYDLLADPMEKNNLHEKNPEVAERLKAGYDKWFDDVSATRPNNYAPPRIVIGTDHETSTWLTMQDIRPQGPGWGTSGQWLLSAPKAQKYRISYLSATPFATGTTAELNVAGIKKSQPVADGKIVFENVSIPAGEHQLSAMTTTNGKEKLPWQVLLERQ